MTAKGGQCGIGLERSSNVLTIDNPLDHENGCDQRVLCEGTSCVDCQVDGCLTFQRGAKCDKKNAMNS